MHRAGLAALAETYALKSDELYQVRLMFERTLEQWRIACGTLGVVQLKNASTDCRVQTVADFAAAFEPGAFVTAILMGNELIGLFCLDQSLARILLDGAMGIDEDPASSAAVCFTTVEKKVLAGTFIPGGARTFIETFGALLRDPSQLTDGSGEVLELSSRSERVASATASFESGSRSGKAGACILFSSLLPARAHLVRTNPELQLSQRKPRATKPVKSVSVELQAVLRNMKMPLRQIFALRPGDLLMLGKLGDKGPRLELRCAGRALYEGIVVEDQGRLRFLIEAKGKENGTTGNQLRS